MRHHWQNNRLQCFHIICCMLVCITPGQSVAEGAWLNAAITQNTQHSKSRLIPHSTARTLGLILSFVLPWFSSKTCPWHSWHVCVPGGWWLLSGGKKAVNKIKQKYILASLLSVVTATYNQMLCRFSCLLFCNWLRLRGTIIKT